MATEKWQGLYLNVRQWEQCCRQMTHGNRTASQNVALFDVSLAALVKSDENARHPFDIAVLAIHHNNSLK